MPKRRRLGLAPMVGLVVVVPVVVLAVVWIANVAGKMTEDSVGSCTDQHNTVYPLGSCAPVLTGSDFAAGRAAISGRWTRQRTGQSQISYTYRNNTPTERSLDWRLVTATDPDGRTTECWGDDSAYRYKAPPGADVESYGGCVLPVATGQYRLFYDKVQVAVVEAPG